MKRIIINAINLAINSIRLIRLFARMIKYFGNACFLIMLAFENNAFNPDLVAVAKNSQTKKPCSKCLPLKLATSPYSGFIGLFYPLVNWG